MGLFKRLFGICETKPPLDDACWDFSEGKVEIDLERASELTNPGGAIRLEGKGLPEKVLVVNGNDGSLHAFHNKCTHGGRRIDPLAQTENIRCCSVSKSTFDYSGQLISGPAKGPLKAYKLETENGKATISID
ncbi:MAG: Rieske (2Fe-2S) protein [Deltaproteobacteria bacterium]|nr:Rieske (2Fe-2S) protein [Deltaproteobacteria bacterium]MBW2053573.1 Rieske (2Fe-2S) protein [Deltaproteobacteria bacterium]MBW2142394.1 Rieske (2Fe-2S) protein [Deltaproteobacteria bacterium]MBW2324203.1 Rieske (2Fe-2S) protein [Deltaproteobacteria bacterium]